MDEDGTGPDPITGLSEHTHYGRPDWQKLFQTYSKVHHGETIGVFVCGPKVISDQLSEKCASFTKEKTIFRFNKENF